MFQNKEKAKVVDMFKFKQGSILKAKFSDKHIDRIILIGIAILLLVLIASNRPIKLQDIQSYHAISELETQNKDLERAIQIQTRLLQVLEKNKQLQEQAESVLNETNKILDEANLVDVEPML